MNVFDVLREKLEQASQEMIAGYYVRATEFKNKMLEIINKTEQEYNNGWIPCSERLPENNKVVLCWVRSTTISSGETFIIGSCDHGFWSLQTYEIGHHHFPVKDYEVIAWQPLPAPFRENDIKRKQTNADRIRTMSDEELTKIIMCPYDTAGASIDIMPCVTELGTQELVSPEFCNQCMMKWLQREVDT